eukprot:1004707-Heterocapsa_arctica.AAC.2
MESDGLQRLDHVIHGRIHQRRVCAHHADIVHVHVVQQLTIAQYSIQALVVHRRPCQQVRTRRSRFVAALREEQAPREAHRQHC